MNWNGVDQTSKSKPPIQKTTRPCGEKTGRPPYNNMKFDAITTWKEYTPSQACLSLLLLLLPTQTVCPSIPHWWALSAKPSTVRRTSTVNSQVSEPGLKTP